MDHKDFINIKLIVYDFDGVMTDNTVSIDQNGVETVRVNRGDGLGVSEIKKLGYSQIIISTELNPVVSARASKLGITCLQGIDNKKEALLNYCQSNDIDLKTVAYVGNDINDQDAMEIVSLTICPKDSHESIKDISKIVLSKRGGEGVARELFDMITDTGD